MSLRTILFMIMGIAKVKFTTNNSVAIVLQQRHVTETCCIKLKLLSKVIPNVRAEATVHI